MSPSDARYSSLISSAVPDYESIGSISRDDDPDEVFGGAEGRKKLEKQLLRKLDRRVMFLVLVSIMNYLDRYNAAAARLQGLEEDLGMSGREFNTLISILYVGYVLMQVPSNMFLSSIQRPSLYLSFCAFLWGVFSIGTGVSQTFSGALTSRFFLGFCEAAWHPGSMFLLSKWYKHSELGWRIAIITSGSTISYAFGAVVASGVMEVMDGIFGFAGWRWLFLMEGSMTVVISFLAIFIIPDYPTSPATWLTPQEQALARRRMEEETHGGEHSDQSEQTSGLVQVISDGRVWLLSMALFCLYACHSFGNFFPTLSATMGYSPTISLLLCAPPWVLATVSAILISSHSDLSGERFWHMAIPLMICISGFALAMSTMNTAVRYFSLFLMTQASVTVDLFMAWVSNSFSHSSRKRAVALALINSLAMTGNIGASYFWPSSWGPSYIKSYMLCALTGVVALASLWHYRSHLERLNKAAEEEEREEGLTKGFRYLL